VRHDAREAAAGKLSGATLRGRERASRGREAVGVVLEGHVARRRAARGSWSSRKWPAKAVGSWARGRAGGGAGG
jgi:hypothetical protein